MSIRRYTLKRDPLWQAPLLLIAATESNSYVELRDDDLVARFGVYEADVPFSAIRAAARRDWAVWNGIGIRITHERCLGLVGSTDGVVQLELEGHNVSFLTIQCQKLAFSLDEPDAFLADLNTRLGGAGPA